MNWLLLVSASMAFAMLSTPGASCWRSGCNSSGKWSPVEPVPVPSGSPVWTTKPGFNLVENQAVVEGNPGGDDL